MAALFPRRPPHEDVTKIPTPPLQTAALFINFFFPSVALLVVSLRCYSRLSMRQWGIDDTLMMFALMFALLMVGPFYMDIKLSYIGWRAVDVPEFDPMPGRWWFFLFQLFYNPVLAFVKASILMFLLRLGGHKRSIRLAIYALNTFNAMQGVAVFIVALLQCLPIAANWDPMAHPDAKCVDVSFHVAISCLTVFTDILVLALPFWIFMGLKLPRASKVAVIGVFMLGGCVTIVAIVRLVKLYRFFYVIQPNADHYHDIGITLSTVETNLAIVSASIPALRPLFKKWLPALFGGSSSKYGSGMKAKPSTCGGTSRTARTGGHATYDGGNGTNSTIALRSMRANAKNGHTECRSASPNGSEEEIMTYNGILKSTDVRVQYANHDEQSMSGASTTEFPVDDRHQRRASKFER